MGEKELRLALVCYGGVSLAVYMHGVTKEIWHLARASRDFTAGDQGGSGAPSPSQTIYREILQGRPKRSQAAPARRAGHHIRGECRRHQWRVPRSCAGDGPVDRTADRPVAARRRCRCADRSRRPSSLALHQILGAADPLAAAAPARRHGGAHCRAETRREVRRKLSSFIRARWFAPPFGGEGFTGLLLDACDAMAANPAGPPLIPDGHPLDLFVTTTDFTGHVERLLLNSPPETARPRHRLSIAFGARGGRPRRLASPPELVFASRATAAFRAPSRRSGARARCRARQARARLARPAVVSRAHPAASCRRRRRRGRRADRRIGAGQCTVRPGHRRAQGPAGRGAWSTGASSMSSPRRAQAPSG